MTPKPDLFTRLVTMAKEQGAFVDECIKEAKKAGTIPENFIPKPAFVGASFECPLKPGYPCGPFSCWKPEAPTNNTSQPELVSKGEPMYTISETRLEDLYIGFTEKEKIITRGGLFEEVLTKKEPDKEQMMICENAALCKNPCGHANPHILDENTPFELTGCKVECVRPLGIDGSRCVPCKGDEIPVTTKTTHLEKGMVVKHKEHGFVYITGGSYMGTYGISNFFEWKKILPDGTLDKKEYHDYDNRGMFEATLGRVK